jgi:uncharacterized protein YyaL (SSP411 family)
MTRRFDGRGISVAGVREAAPLIRDAPEAAPMTDAGRNRLAEEASPYLRQHADNPVDWQPWDEAALAEARERDVPVFLSVGYAACHWCHVMEEESFQDEAVAEVLNDRFVPIKVDREERPDLDRVYQTVCQLVTGGGGWPLSVWLTPDREPFYVGTYFPPEPRRGTPGFRDLLENVAASWDDPDDRAEMENRADQWAAAARDQLEETTPTPGDPPTADALDDAASAALRAADRDHGGFGRTGPKFPQPARLELLLRAHARSGDPEPLAVVRETLDAMADGGLYDHVGGGFHRYATDREWVVPHFEKMLYDNAELPRLYLLAHRATGRPRYARVATETLAFLERELRHPDGGFYGTLDAQSEGEEGTFYVWTPDAVDDAVDDDVTAALLRDHYGVTAGGNFEGKTVLTRAATASALADDHGLPVGEVRERLAAGRIALFDARSERPRPARDEKVIAGWNGLAVSAFALGGQTLDPAVAETGAEALSFVRENLWDGDRLARRYIDGDVAGDGYLEDYAFLARGALDCYGATGDHDHLGFALDLGRAVVESFWDDDAGTLYFTPEGGERLIARPQELTDRSTPSSVGVAAATLLDLAQFGAGDDRFSEVAEAVLATHADRVRGSPLEHVSLALAADRLASGPLELTVAPADLPADWWERLSETYLPGGLLAPRPATEAELAGWLDDLGLEEAPPIWADRGATDGEPTVYACRSFTCSPPTHDLAEALDYLGV